MTYVIGEGFTAAFFDGQYSYMYNFISDLGVPSYSPLAYLMNAALYIEGVLFLGGAVLMVRADLCRKPVLFLCIAGVLAIGTILVGSAHDGSTERTHLIAWLHYIGTHFAMLGGNAAVLIGSFSLQKASFPAWYRPVSLALGVFGLLSFAMLAFAMKTPSVLIMPPAAWERSSVYTIIIWQTVTGALLLARTLPSLRAAPAERLCQTP